MVLLGTALSLAPVWDRTIFVKALLQALNTDPELLQPAYEDLGDVATGGKSGVQGTTLGSNALKDR